MICYMYNYDVFKFIDYFSHFADLQDEVLFWHILNFPLFHINLQHILKEKEVDAESWNRGMQICLGSYLT
jgi:hypothetical protein